MELDIFPTLVIYKKGFINFSILDRLRRLKPLMSKHDSIKGDGLSSFSNDYDVIKNDDQSANEIYKVLNGEDKLDTFLLKNTVQQQEYIYRTSQLKFFF